MQKRSTTLAVVVMIGAMLACYLPAGTGGAEAPGAVLTAAALTVQAEIATQTPTPAPPAASPAPDTATPTATPVPLPSFTAAPLFTPTTTCDLARFLTDITVPDGTTFSPGDPFTKTWRLQNIGSCTWTGYALVFDSGDAMGGAPISAIPTTPPGAYVDISVALNAPGSDGSYRGYWRIRNTSSVLIPIQAGFNGQSFYVDIQVNSGGGGGGPFSVTHVGYSLSWWSGSGYTHCPRVTAQITTNAGGTVTYHWTRSDGASAPTNTLTFGSAGTQSIHDDWALGHYWSSHVPAGGFWMGIYIDSPNHQGFGHQVFTVACTAP